MRPVDYREQELKCCQNCAFARGLNEYVLGCFYGEEISRGVLLRIRAATGTLWIAETMNRSVSPTGICDDFKDQMEE